MKEEESGTTMNVGELGENTKEHGNRRLCIQRSECSTTTHTQTGVVDFVLHIEPNRKVYVNKIKYFGKQQNPR